MKLMKKVLFAGLALSLVFVQGIATADAASAKASKADKNRNSLPDQWEKKYKLKGKGIAQKDNDKDGLSNLVEYQLNLNPVKLDTDRDRIPDGQEDKDRDQLSNMAEVQVGTKPTNPDTDGDKIKDGAETNKDGIKFSELVRELEIEVESDNDEFEIEYEFKKGKAYVKASDSSVSKEDVLKLVKELEQMTKVTEEAFLEAVEKTFTFEGDYEMEAEVEFFDGMEVEVEKAVTKDSNEK